jgi:hypothetical protein
MIEACLLELCNVASLTLSTLFSNNSTIIDNSATTKKYCQNTLANAIKGNNINANASMEEFAKRQIKYLESEEKHQNLEVEK